jgi:hypothetical protein
MILAVGLKPRKVKKEVVVASATIGNRHNSVVADATETNANLIVG